MRLKILSLLLIICVLTTSIAFALPTKLAPVEIISPDIDKTGSVTYESALNITLRLNEDVNATLRLVRIEQPDMPFVSTEALGAINAIASEAPTAWLSTKDGLSDPAPKVELASLYDNAMTLDQLTEIYVAQGDRVMRAHNRYKKAYYEARSAFSVDVLQSYIAERQLLSHQLDILYVARNDYEEQAILFLLLQAKYNRSFRYSVVSQVHVAQDGPLPYFNYTINQLLPGRYELSIRDKTSGRLLIAKRRFTIVK